MRSLTPNTHGEPMFNLHKVCAAICIGGFAVSPVMYFRNGVASPLQTNIIMIADDVPSETEVRSAILQQAKKEDDKDLAVLKNKLNQDVSQCRRDAISHCTYTDKTMMGGNPLADPGWYYYGYGRPDGHPFDSQNSCAQSAVKYCDPAYPIEGNSQTGVEILKDRADIENFRYTADDWVMYVKSINNYEGNIIAHVTFRKKRTESDTYSKKVSMERQNGVLVILAIENE